MWNLRIQDLVDRMESRSSAAGIRCAGVVQDSHAFGAASSEFDATRKPTKRVGKVVRVFSRVELVRDVVVKVQHSDALALGKPGDGLKVGAKPGLGSCASDRLRKL